MRISVLIATVIFVVLLVLVSFQKYFLDNRITRVVMNLENKDIQKNYSLQVVGAIPYWDQDEAKKSYLKNPQVFNYISLFWYYLTPEGEIINYKAAHIDESLINEAQAHGTKVLALIANLPDAGGGDWDSGRVDTVISSQEVRRMHIAAILQLLHQHNFDGVSIDYEALKQSQKDNFSRFIKELSAELHAQNKIVSVALHPKTTEGKASESNGSEAQDWKELGKYADQMRLMTYEQHNSSTDPGPSATNEWNRKVVAYAKKLIPAEKIFLGVGLYGYEWPEDDEIRGLTNNKVNQIISKHEPSIERDEESDELHFVYSDEDDDEFEVWYNDAESVRHRVDFARMEGLGGVAFWRLGGEDENIWNY